MARYEMYGATHADTAPAAAAADALFELGKQFWFGRDVEPDLVQAHKWFNLAALRGNPEAKQYRMDLAQEMTRVEIAQAQRMAREWLSQG